MSTGSSARAAACALLAAALVTGCTGGEQDPEMIDLSENTSAVTVEEMGRLGARVYLEPERAPELVEEAGLTPDEFETRIRTITDDLNKSLVYAGAFEAELEAAGGGAPATAGVGGDEPSGGR